MRSHASDSEVQRRAEAIIRGLLAQRLGVSLRPETVYLETGTPVQVDAVAADESVLAEIFARQGKLKPGQQKKVAIDSLKLITLGRGRHDTRLVLVFADEEAAAYATGGGWLAQTLRTWGVEVVVLEIAAELRQQILAAQDTQKMVNADEVAEDVI